MSRIIWNSDTEQTATQQPVEQKKKAAVKPNLFQGRTDAAVGNAKFPDWDIVPPNMIINPRIRPQS
jgi:hypothetical protein